MIKTAVSELAISSSLPPVAPPVRPPLLRWVKSTADRRLARAGAVSRG